MDSHVSVTPCVPGRVSTGGHKGLSSCGKTSLVTISFNTRGPCKALGSTKWVLKTLTKRSKGRLSVGQGVRMGLPQSLTCFYGPGHLHTEVGFLKEVLPELCKVRKGGKIPARQNGVCKKRERHIMARFCVQTLRGLEWLESTG